MVQILLLTLRRESIITIKHGKPDVAERGMDEEVHGLVWHALPPLNVRNRKTEPEYVPNGSAIGDWDENAFA